MGLNIDQAKAIAELYTELKPLLKKYARRLLINPALTDEVIHDAFRIACANADSLLQSTNPKGWIVKTVRNIILHANRGSIEITQHLVAYLLLDVAQNEIDYEKTELSATCQKLLGEEYYKLLELVVFQHYTYVEAGRELNITPAACAKRFQRARIKLKEFFEKNK